MRRRIHVISEAELERRPWLLDDADELTRMLFIQRGVLTTTQARTHLSADAIKHLLARGDWQRLHRGCYLVGPNPPSEEQRRWAAVLAAGDGAFLGGRTALAVLGLNGFASERVHVLLPATRRSLYPPDGVVVHRTRNLPLHHIAGGFPPCTSAERSLVDAASWARSDREALTVVAMAFQQRLVALDRVEQVLATLDRAHRRLLIKRAARLAARGAHSLSELRLPDLLRKAGLPQPKLQVGRVDSDGRQRYFDLYFEEWLLHVEIDGAHHLDVRQAWADADRQNKLWTKGERVLRFPAWVVLERPDEVVKQIRTALIAAGWRPTSDRGR